MLATQLRGERGDAYVALESAMRAHAREGGGVRENQRGQRNGNSREGRRQREMAGDEKKGEAIREMWNQRNRKRREI